MNSPAQNPTSSFVITRPDSWCSVNSSANGGQSQQHLQQACIMLGHRDLMKGVPSFMLNDTSDLVPFINGFLFRSHSSAWEHYSKILWDTLGLYNNELPVLFGAYTLSQSQQAKLKGKSPIDTSRSLPYNSKQ